MSDVIQIDPKAKNIKPSKLEVASKYLIFDPMAQNPALYLNNKKGLDASKAWYANPSANTFKLPGSK